MFASFFSEPPSVVIAPIPPKDHETWVPAEDFEMCGSLNIDLELLRNNVSTNIKRGFQQIAPHPTNEVEAMIVGGGPSLKEYIHEIKMLRRNSVKLITLNNAYQYCIDAGVMPSAMVMVDARPFNARFVQNVVPDCKYFMASQCDPDTGAFAVLLSGGVPRSPPRTTGPRP